MSIYRWRIYCTDESAYVDGYLEDQEGTPVTCFNDNSHTIDTVKTKRIEEISNVFTGEVSKWKVYCDTENLYTYGYSEELPYPERCFNNVDHVVSKLPILQKKIKNNSSNVIINEESPTGDLTSGRFRTDGFEISATANTVTRKDFSWPYAISALILRFTSEETHRGDYINCYGRPTTYLNNLSSDVTIGTSILPVNSVTPFSVGMSVVITDSINTESLGKITSKGASTITVQTATAFSYYKNAYISYYNPIGIATVGVTAGDCQITCNSTVMVNIQKGMVVAINDATNTENLGEVFEIDLDTNQITIQNSPEFSYAIGSYLTISLHMIKKYKIGPPTEHTIGTSKIGGSYITKFHVISIEYENKSVSTAKDFNWYTEVLY